MQGWRREKAVRTELRRKWGTSAEDERFAAYKRVLWRRLEAASYRITSEPILPGRKRLHPGRTLAVVGVLIVATTVTALAANALVNLGKPVEIQSTNAYFPLSGFHRIGTSLRLQGKPELLFIGTLDPWDSRSAVERWSVVKALEQFGTLSNARALDRNCSLKELGPGACSKPTFDWSHARYRSLYLTFAHTDVLGINGKALQRLSGQQLQLYNRYARIPRTPSKHDPYDAVNTVLRSSLSANTTRGLPLIGAGGYLQTQSQIVTPGDMEIVPTPVPNA
ncbi:MAG TPA: hypothetical protein VF221_00675, partial [Chloroflexota bacterium]